MPEPFNLILIDLNQSLCNAWAMHFAGMPRVSIACKCFEDLEQFDCLVSPANSFGLMDGGMDAAIIRYFGAGLQTTVQDEIHMAHYGEQFVGTSMIVSTGNDAHPFLAHTPTMRIPMPIANTDNVYRAMSAMLRAVHAHNCDWSRKIKTVACPGLGTATGRMNPQNAALQMAEAYKNFLEPINAQDWVKPVDLQRLINTSTYGEN